MEYWVLAAALGLTVLASARSLADSPGRAPDGWVTAGPRAEIAPRAWVERGDGEPPGGSYALGLAGRGDPAVDGRWQREVPAAADKWYRFQAHYRAERVAMPMRSIAARVVWLDAEGRQVGQPEYPDPAREGVPRGWQALSGTYRAPEGAARARLELHLRWAPRGKVWWRGADLRECEAPAARRVRLATINHRPSGSTTPEGNLSQFVPLLEEAARQRADIVCLGEGITLAGTGKTYVEVAEPIPGPSTRFLGELAARHRLYIVAGLLERQGRAVYNTAVLMGRDGSLVGRYRKLCLPREEVEGGVTAGSDYPVFDTDFGRVGIMICWDLSYPEVARGLSARGAEVILMPIWGGSEPLARARAIEDQVYLVASGYDFRSAIYDRTGQPLAEARTDPEVLVAEVDLAAPTLWPWLGDWRARIWREAPVPLRDPQPVKGGNP